MANSGDNKPDIVLNSPVGAKPALYKWPLTYVLKGQKIDGAEEIIETIRWVGREFSEFKPAIENLIPGQPDSKSYDCIKSLCDRYNKILESVLKMNKGTSVAPKTSSRASQGLLKHIIQQVYNYAVADPTELNKYSPFSSETYGETSFDFMAQLIEKNQFRPREHDVFIDLGSGVGHLVLQMAASVECKMCYGVEIADVPAGYAKVMKERFKFWMNWHGKIYSDFELFHGDFFDKDYVDIIKSAAYILVNNYAFKPEVDHKLKQRFHELNDGVQILSSKPFCSPKHRVTERHMTDIGSIMKVHEIRPELKKDTVSWTHKPLPYYLHVIDATTLQKYFQRQKRRQGRSAEKGRPNKRRKADNGSDASDDSDDNVVYGPTTRKAWLEWTQSTSAGNRVSTDSIKSSRNNSTDTENYESAIETEDKDKVLDKDTDKVHDKDKVQNKDKVQVQDKDLDKEKVLVKDTDKVHDKDKVQNKDKDKVQDKDKGRGKEKDSSSKTKSNENQKRDKRTQDTQISSNDRPTIVSQGTSAQAKASLSANQAAKSCLDKKRDYASKKTTANPCQNEKSYSCLTKTTTEVAVNGSSPSKVPPLVIKVTPPVETKAVDEAATKNASSSKNGSPKQEVKSKVNDENGKQLRQRKKSNATAQSAPTQASTSAPTPKSTSKSDTKTNPPASGTNSILNSAANGTRGAKRAQQAGSKVPAKAPAVNSKKRAMSSDKNSSLDLLHAKTVESVSGSAGYFPQPAPGCEDHNLTTIVETPSLPRVVVKNIDLYINEIRSSKMTEKITEIVSSELDSLARKFQQPIDRAGLERDVRREIARQNYLLYQAKGLELHNKELSDRLNRCIKVHCNEFGIDPSPRSIVNHLGGLLKKHQELSAYSHRLETLQSNQRTMNPPAAHSSNSSLLSPYHRSSTSSATLDLSLKQGA